MYSKYTNRSTPERMKGSAFASYIWDFNPKLTNFAKNSPQNRSFYQIKHRVHSCDIIILLEKLYFTTSNNLTKKKTFCGKCVFIFYQQLENQKKAKNGKKRQFWVRYPYLGCKNEPLQYFWARCFHISETQRCSNKRKT